MWRPKKGDSFTVLSSLAVCTKTSKSPRQSTSVWDSVRREIVTAFSSDKSQEYSFTFGLNRLGVLTGKSLSPFSLTSMISSLIGRNRASIWALPDHHESFGLIELRPYIFRNSAAFLRDDLAELMNSSISLMEFSKSLLLSIICWFPDWFYANYSQQMVSLKFLNF